MTTDNQIHFSKLITELAKDFNQPDVSIECFKNLATTLHQEFIQAGNNEEDWQTLVEDHCFETDAYPHFRQ